MITDAPIEAARAAAYGMHCAGRPVRDMDAPSIPDRFADDVGVSGGP